MKLAANLTLLYPGLTLPERIRSAAQDGFTGVEILFPYDMPAKELARHLQAHQLKLALINTPPGANGEKGLACLPGAETQFLVGLKQALDVCQVTACRNIHVMAGMPPADAHPSVCRSTLISNLRKAAALASSAGITLTLEALNRDDMPGYFYYLPAQVADIIAEVGSPTIRLQLDFYHCQREHLDLNQELCNALPLIHHVQFASVVQRREPDLTDPAVCAALRSLQSAGYQGWVGCEYHPEADTSTGLAWRKSYQALLEHRL
ncbi:TIM barrel protein [Pusillimonas sp. MFBS29]|uniref:hydroxypyruvate isomerase family protein n=1 Tax=Pusillimonas sp. MFBS29 TaxID=2886690 RepID=UPI001D11E0F7|nr:TIM barrel protein [Pusillimonas sp. MFBS29]MCC2595814.1 TIM barrel protein [Pusillimonas sp. MFBS29]